MRRTISQPGWSLSNRKAVRPLRASSEVRAIRMKCCASPGAGDVPFAAVDHPAVALALRHRLHHRRVRPAARMRLGHREGAADLAVDDRLKPALLLRCGPDLVQHHHVAVVGCGRVEADRPEDRPVHLLVAGGHADQRQALPAPLLRHLERPQPFGLRLGAQPLQGRRADVLVLVPVGAVRLHRQDLALDEGADPLAIILDLGRQGKVHREAPSSRLKRTHEMTAVHGDHRARHV